jgi:signal transduction histidine kinase
MGTSDRSKWAANWFSEQSGVLRHWLLLYFLIVMLAVVADVSYCKLGPLPVLWAQVLPEFHYIGVIFAATCFGARIGFVAGCAAGLLHLAAITMACSQPGSQLGHLTMFAGIGLITGWITQGQYNYSIPVQTTIPGVGEVGRGSSLADLGRMMPDLVQQLLTPIASIEGAGYVLEESDLSDDKRREFVGIIRKECRRLELLVETLDFTDSRSRVYEEASVSRLLDEVVERCRMTADSRITLRNVAPLDSIRIRCDPELIKYALQTLTANAIRAIRPSGRVELSASPASGEIVITVEAHPEPPVSPSMDTTITGDLSGTDLAIVQQILNRHWGSVRIVPSTGGLTTYIILPLKSV